MAALSFHETKNIISGEGGALLINDPRFVERAEIIWEKGTNRSQFFRGQVDKYTWVDLGSSYLPGEIVAAFLWAQMEEADAITDAPARHLGEVPRSVRGPRSGRHGPAADRPGRLPAQRAPVLPARGRTSRHAPTLIDRLKGKGIQSVFHYVPLHLSPFGRSVGRVAGDMEQTVAVSERLVRLPLWLGLEDQLDEVIREVLAAL